MITQAGPLVMLASTLLMTEAVCWCYRPSKRESHEVNHSMGYCHTVFKRMKCWLGARILALLFSVVVTHRSDRRRIGENDLGFARGGWLKRLRVNCSAPTSAPGKPIAVDLHRKYREARQHHCSKCVRAFLKFDLSSVGGKARNAAYRHRSCFRSVPRPMCLLLFEAR